MLNSMYSGVSGMRGFQTKLDVIGNNIANVNTVGYQKSRVLFEDLLSQSVAGNSVNSKQVGLGSSVSAINMVDSPGSPMTTGVQTDLSIQGNGYFTVRSDGTDYLARSGSFQVDATGNLVTTQGYAVLDDQGNPIQQIGEIKSIDRNGVITYTDTQGNEQQTLNLGISTVPNPGGLNKVGNSLFRETEKSGDAVPGLPQDSRVVAGQLEMSNVDLTEEFTEMIVAQRGFQANSRVITTSDEILQEIVNLKR
ncbi:flagellar hook-basal body complex protein [Anaerobacillus sp. 1_MG-2023]|uniref:flagellar hook-basal body complex protein n=1 Tax=Anaerobacillus sp. 1_MG-2023 TaxID=3062655 RepID=UPI0026E21303|nr:flagellar hook-basal body complex protein [Anaerobacillus sp. 1_MG-2023]MDO6656343.1 flagellar hook-basal body complex protein [Anaerobacillus sp. 1_MG-2023]